MKLKKAFDTVDHLILLRNLEHYGVRGIINDWFSTYLLDRIQTTQIGSGISNKDQMLTGVPQGSVLGPLLFLIYVNDIYKLSNKLTFYLFADDTNLLYADKNLKSLENIVNIELSKICNWLTANKLFLNIKKSNYVIFHPYQKKPNYQIDLKCLIRVPIHMPTTFNVIFPLRLTIYTSLVLAIFTIIIQDCLASRVSYSSPQVKTNYGKFNIRYSGACLWNSIDEDAKNLPKTQFKNRLIRTILDRYSGGDC